MDSAPTQFQSTPPSIASSGGPRWRWPGLQQKLVFSFMGMLALAMGVSCWLVISESRDALDSLVDEQTLEMSRTLGMASQTPLAINDRAELNRIGRDLLKHRDVVGVAFFAVDGTRLTIASEDPDLEQAGETILASPRRDASVLLRPHRRWLAALGRFVEVTAPVFTMVTRDETAASKGPASDATTSSIAGSARHFGPHLVGYVSICVSQTYTDAAFHRARMSVILISATAMLAALPIAFTLIHRLFEPVRRLVTATDRVAAGDLDQHVDVTRSDLIGTLAISFNRMAQRVRDQQRELAGANARLADANRDLEEKVQQRTGQLETANARLRGEITEKEDFLRAVSHDLNAPLRNIAGMAMMLMKKRDAFDDDVVHRLERIQKNVEVETDLISELLELSRIKTRRQRMEAVDVEALVADVAGTFEEDLGAGQIELSADTPLPVIHGERARWRQVFQNLIDNAIKYMGDSPDREIQIGCAVRPDAAEFYVRDTGIGISSDDAEQVFHVFRRGKSAQVQKIAGKGVGLSSVKSIIETYGGRIWVESRLGSGSTFRFTIDGRHLIAAGAADMTDRPVPELAGTTEDS